MAQETPIEYQIIRGLPFPTGLMWKKENIEQALDYCPRDGDIIIASYPKTGTTWLQYTVLQIISKGELFPSMQELDRVCPFMEIAGVAAVQSLQELRSYKHHFPYNMVKKNPKAKYLYIYRNPEDTVTSYFHFLKNRGSYKCDFQDFFERFIRGEQAYGCYFDHVLSYFAAKEDKNILLVSYEKLQANRKAGILEIAKFLGENYYKSMIADNSVLEKVLEKTSFDYMKNHLRMILPAQENDRDKPQEITFFRKGVVGDGKDFLTNEQKQRLRALMLSKVQDRDLLAEWSSR
ncbi:sulfotransferase family cytosolic 1B member 1-like [Stegodyphus dumicola]|uniref:sulfotransferase family cytosolic 1B member 1-like n=1 Tax=Stegodyphus dumicola TaxID=202533 RepID=UPI0015AF2282|nr:sulfotransferase family cytosolic 1B member 1-like [Stegodyphus dumicola]XP_035214111.1 sulfotransferase family cytosolic 1B member 1-like [Stegodyphus dumicola]